MAALKDMIPNATAAERDLVTRFGELKDDPRRQRAFEAFAATGLPHRRMEAWKWSDFKSAIPDLNASFQSVSDLSFEASAGQTIRVTGEKVDVSGAEITGLRIFTRDTAEAFGGAEEMPLGALAAALTGNGETPAAILIDVTEPIAEPVHLIVSGASGFASSRVMVIVRPGASLRLIERHLGGAALNTHLLELSIQAGGSVQRTVYQSAGADQAQAITADIRLDAEASFTQTQLAFGGRMARLETRLTHQETGSRAILDAAYLAAKDHHIDITTHVRHGAEACETEQVTKGAVMDGGRGVFQGKFLVPRYVGQRTQADMQHHALLLENGAEVNAKPELEIYADDVECAHGNTCGALDDNQLFYLRQRGLPLSQAKALLTEAFVAEALERADVAAVDVLRQAAADWLANKI